MTDRYVYASWYKTRQRAEEVLEDLYATGEVCEGERPQVEGRKAMRDGQSVTRYCITLEA